MWAMSTIGVNLTQQSTAQWNQGLSAWPLRDKAQLKRGDLVFFTSVAGGSTIDHVGIYIGTGYDANGVASTDLYIHAPNTGDVVKLSHLNSGGTLPSRYYGHKRYY